MACGTEFVVSENVPDIAVFFEVSDGGAVLCEGASIEVFVEGCGDESSEIASSEEVALRSFCVGV